MGDRDLHKQPGQSKEAPAKKMRRTIQAAAILKWTSADDKLNAPISGDDGNDRIQFDFCGKLPPYYLIFEVSINTTETTLSQRK